MPFEPLKAEDIALVNRLLTSQPDLQDTISIIKQVSAKAKYPIASFDDLAQSLGGDKGNITFRGRTLSVAEARAVIPAYYFPIASESDLTAKMADLAKGLPPASGGGAVTTVLSGTERAKDESRINPSMPATQAPNRPGVATLKLPK